MFCLDSSGLCPPLPPAFLHQPALSAKLPLSGPERRWVCVVVGGRSCYTRNDQRPVGNFIMRQRQLRAVGYTVMEVSCEMILTAIAYIVCCMMVRADCIPSDVLFVV